MVPTYFFLIKIIKNSPCWVLFLYTENILLQKMSWTIILSKEWEPWFKKQQHWFCVIAECLKHCFGWKWSFLLRRSLRPHPAAPEVHRRYFHRSHWTLHRGVKQPALVELIRISKWKNVYCNIMKWIKPNSSLYELEFFYVKYLLRIQLQEKYNKNKTKTIFNIIQLQHCK